MTLFFTKARHLKNRLLVKYAFGNLILDVCLVFPQASLEFCSGAIAQPVGLTLLSISLASWFCHKWTSDSEVVQKYVSD